MRSPQAGRIRAVGLIRSRRSARVRSAGALSTQGRRQQKGHCRAGGSVLLRRRGARAGGQDLGDSPRRGHSPATGSYVSQRGGSGTTRNGEILRGPARSFTGIVDRLHAERRQPRQVPADDVGTGGL